jgi:uncharacterized protein YndB with AHSA1/START domain
MRVQRSIEIAAPPEKIWPFLVEPEKILKWVNTFKKFEYTGEQRSGVGTTIYIEEKAGGPLMKLNFTVTEWVENKRLALSMTSGTGVTRYELAETIEATEADSKFTFMESFELPWGIVGKLLESVGRRTAEGHIEESLAKLKNLAET